MHDILNNLSTEKLLTLDITSDTIMNKDNNILEICKNRQLKIETLLVGNNTVNDDRPETLEKIIEYISHENCVLKNLIFKNIYFRTSFNEIYLYTNLMSSIQNYGKLKSLQIECKDCLGTDRSNNLINCLSNYLRETDILEELYLDNIYISKNGIKKLLYNIDNNNTNIDNVNIDNINNKSLKRLKISNAGLNDVSIFCKFIENNNTLEELILNNDRIYEGWDNFFESLTRNNTLKKLKLYDNRLNIDNLNKLFTCLKYQNSIEKLDSDESIIGCADYTGKINDFSYVIQRGILKELLIEQLYE